MSSSDRQRRPFVMNQLGDVPDSRGLVVLRLHEAGPRSKDVAEVLGEPFVDPKQLRALGGVEVGGDHSLRPAPLAAPGVRELVGQKVRVPGLDLLHIRQVALLERR